MKTFKLNLMIKGLQVLEVGEAGPSFVLDCLLSVQDPGPPRITSFLPGSSGLCCCVSSVPVFTISLILPGPAPKPLLWRGLPAHPRAQLHPVCDSLHSL